MLKHNICHKELCKNYYNDQKDFYLYRFHDKISRIANKLFNANNSNKL